MYKMSEVAEMLSIEKVKIFEALIVHDDKLSPYVKKERHLSYLTEDGVKALEKIIYGIEPELEENYDNEEEIVEEEIEIEEEDIETDYLQEAINKNIQKKENLKKEIIDLKRQINQLDKELRMKDDAILHYQEIFDEDMKWIIEIENKIEEHRSLLQQDEKKSGFFNLLKK